MSEPPRTPPVESPVAAAQRPPPSDVPAAAVERPPSAAVPVAAAQRPPPSGVGESVSAAFLLSGLGRIVREEIEVELRGLDLTMRHLSALGHLSRTPGMSYSELGRRAGVTAQSMQATLRQLESVGAVERTTPAGRGRTAELHVTDAGRDLLSRGKDALRRVDESLLGDLAPAEKDELTRLLLRTFSRVATGRRG